MPYFKVKAEFFESLKHLGSKSQRGQEATPIIGTVDEDAIAAKVAAIIMPGIKTMLEETLAKLMSTISHQSPPISPPEPSWDFKMAEDMVADPNVTMYDAQDISVLPFASSLTARNDSPGSGEY